MKTIEIKGKHYSVQDEVFEAFVGAHGEGFEECVEKALDPILKKYEKLKKWEFDHPGHSCVKVDPISLLYTELANISALTPDSGDNTNKDKTS